MGGHDHSNGSGWWLAGGETCLFCLQEFAVGTEYHCLECDRIICPCCVVVVRRVQRVLCPECSEQIADEGM